MLDEPGIFVMGTDTGVGKTVVTAAIALAARGRGRDPAVLKPAQTGDDGAIAGDAEFVAGLIGLDEPLDAVCPYRLRAPLAPAVAAALEGRRLDPQVVARAYNDLAGRHDLVLVEAAGGALVPFSDGVDMAALASLLGLPVVVAIRPGLGTLNHTLLTLEALHRRGLTVLGVVISGHPAEPGLDHLTNPRALSRLTPVPLLGAIPFDPGIDVEGGRHGRLAEIGPPALDPLLGGTFSPARFRREGEARLAALAAPDPDTHERSPVRGPD
jgi:dethiobiotin synthetase